MFTPPAVVCPISVLQTHALLDILLLMEVAEMGGYKGRIDTLERWADAVEYFRNNEYSLFQFGNDVDTPEGFHAIYWRPEGPDIEIITYNQDVCDAIFEFERSRSKSTEKKYKRRQ